MTKQKSISALLLLGETLLCSAQNILSGTWGWASSWVFVAAALGEKTEKFWKKSSSIWISIQILQCIVTENYNFFVLCVCSFLSPMSNFLILLLFYWEADFSPLNSVLELLYWASRRQCKKYADKIL